MPWETDESSAFLTNFRGTVKDAVFTTDPRYNDGNTTLLTLECSVDEVTQDGFDGEVPEETTVTYPLPPDWFSENGKLAEHKKGKTKFHASSMYGRIIDAVLGKVENYGGPQVAVRTDGEDLEVDLTGLQDVLVERGEPQEAQIWIGLNLEFAEVHFDFGPDKKSKDKDARLSTRRAMPVKFLGADGKPAAAKPATTEATAPAATPPAEPSEATQAAEQSTAEKIAAARQKAQATTTTVLENPFSALTDNADLAKRMNDVLTASADYGSYLDGLLAIPDLVTDDALLQAVADEKTGPWASKPA